MASKKKQQTKKVAEDIQSLADGSYDVKPYRVSVFGKIWNIEHVEHVKLNVYTVYLRKGDEERQVSVSAEHAVFVVDMPLEDVKNEEADSDDIDKMLDENLDLPEPKGKK